MQRPSRDARAAPFQPLGANPNAFAESRRPGSRRRRRARRPPDGPCGSTPQRPERPPSTPLRARAAYATGRLARRLDREMARRAVDLRRRRGPPGGAPIPSVRRGNRPPRTPRVVHHRRRLVDPRARGHPVRQHASTSRWPRPRSRPAARRSSTSTGSPRRSTASPPAPAGCGSATRRPTCARATPS